MSMARQEERYVHEFKHKFHQVLVMLKLTYHTSESDLKGTTWELSLTPSK